MNSVLKITSTAFKVSIIYLAEIVVCDYIQGLCCKTIGKANINKFDTGRQIIIRQNSLKLKNIIYWEVSDYNS